MVEIETIATARQLGEVWALWRKNSETLGFFTKGAFEEYATNRTILLALQNDRVVGYLLYRKSKRCASIAHLCVASRSRGKGISKKLVDELISKTKDCIGVSVKCRSDFPANSLWPNLGFHAQSYLKGRGKEEKELVRWWRSHGEDDLFSYGATCLCALKLTVAIDMNVLIDLYEKPSKKNAASRALQADWLADDIELFVTVETFNEIHRNEDIKERNALRGFALNFHVLPDNADDNDKILKSFDGLWPQCKTEQNVSDHRQLSRAISGKADFFVTRDEGLLKRASPVEECHDIVIISPADLILRLDELQRANEYKPARFAESTLTWRLLRATDIPCVSSMFHNSPLRETKRRFTSLIRDCVADVTTQRAILVHNDKFQGLVLVSEMEECFEIPVFRIARDKLALTIARQMIKKVLLTAQSLKYEIIRITDRNLQDNIKAILPDFGFIYTDVGWEKLSFYGLNYSTEIADRILSLSSRLSIDKKRLASWTNDCLRNAAFVSDPKCASWLESMLWPVKIRDACIPNYIVPIQPRWASELFDEELASSNLFGRKTELAMNTEAVYYRSARGQIKFPARILWYVSSDRSGNKPQSIRACSRLDEVTVDLPKPIFRRYKHLGIYPWHEVCGIVKKDLRKSVMALRFSQTEIFKNPVGFHELQKLFNDKGIDGVRSQIIQPFEISEGLFSRIYEDATEINAI